MNYQGLIEKKRPAALFAECLRTAASNIRLRPVIEKMCTVLLPSDKSFGISRRQRPAAPWRRPLFREVRCVFPNCE